MNIKGDIMLKATTKAILSTMLSVIGFEKNQPVPGLEKTWFVADHLLIHVLRCIQFTCTLRLVL